MRRRSDARKERCGTRSKHADAAELAQARDVCTRSAETITRVLVELRGVDILGVSSFGPKICSSLELAAELLGSAAAFLERECERASRRA
jgi:hypothetical protein